MYLNVQKVVYKNRFQGNYLNIEPTQTKWEENGIEHIRYGFRQSGGRFERENVTYEFTVLRSADGDDRQPRVELGVIDWGSMNEPDNVYEAMLNRANIEKIRRVCHPRESELQAFILFVNAEIGKCIRKFQDTYYNSEEYRVTHNIQERVMRWLKAKDRFDSEFGTGYFEEVYNFDLELMNIDLLERLRNQKKQGQNQSSRRERQKESSAGSGAYASSEYSEEEIAYLKKFYKTLAKSYHPDVAHDDGKAMQFLNRLKDLFEVK